MVTLPEPGWDKQANCRGLAGADQIFFPSTGPGGWRTGSAMYRDARQICDGCAVIDSCRADAADSGDLYHGFRAGMTPAERHRAHVRGELRPRPRRAAT